MSIADKLFLGLVVATFGLFYFGLMSVWIWTRAWAPRPQAATRNDHAMAEAPAAEHRLAA